MNNTKKDPKVELRKALLRQLSLTLRLWSESDGDFPLDKSKCTVRRFFEEGKEDEYAGVLVTCQLFDCEITIDTISGFIYSWVGPYKCVHYIADDVAPRIDHVFCDDNDNQ